MADVEPNDEPILLVAFYRTAAGNGPAREWLKRLKREDRNSVDSDIKTAQFGWPLGMPSIRKLEPGLGGALACQPRYFPRDFCHRR